MIAGNTLENRFAEVKPLDIAHANGPKGFHLAKPFHAFGNHLDAEFGSQRDHAGYDAQSHPVLIAILYECAVKLDDVRFQVREPRQS